ncbi:MAG TPA: carboxypeptidase-like regulatory domain-containing protein [Bacteroidales bacterium]
MKLKVLLIVNLVTICALISGQNKVHGYIYDKQTSKLLPFATVGAMNMKYGTYTDTSGFFTLYFSNEHDSLLISYLGFKSVYTTVYDVQRIAKIYLEPNPVQLKEITINPKKTKKKVREIGLFDKKSTGYLLPPYELNIQAAFMAFPKNGEEVVMKSIRFKYKLLKNNSPLRVRILRVTDNGQPGEDMVAENIIFNQYKQNRAQEAVIDILKYNIIMPVNGVFIAFEWIDRDKNLTTTKDQIRDHGPCIGAISNRNTSNPVWSNSYNQRKWVAMSLPLTYAVGLTVVNYTEK